ncbi:glycosyltransferase [Sphingomonas sp. GlSt437]|uniref:glycosyltransferase n=1 Tax=Sphingomonas sp. GlSt437 TaxID=3389970 RepID=UPI003A8A4A18
MIWLGALTLAIWVYLIALHDGFWLTGERDTNPLSEEPLHWPPVIAVVPARDEAEVIARSIGSLLDQDYPSDFHIILVDDNSSDDTALLALNEAAGMDRLTVLSGAPLPRGWTGKLWAVHQGIEAAGDAPQWLWLTDADIAHAPDTLRTLVQRAVGDHRVLVTLMARLRCDSVAERALIPAFVWFFQMLYPFARVNRRTSRLGAAAGGCMLVEREALERAGGIAALRNALIDDCTLGQLMKRQGSVWLALTDRSVSIREYQTWESVAAMISRSAYAQLHYSPLLLAGTVLGLAITYLAPPLLALFASGYARIEGALAWLIMAIAFQPMLRFYRRSPLWGVALPLIASFYGWCTVASARAHWQGKGGMWKGRAQAELGA